MGDLIKFSIAIPAYKNHYLYECISSILQQSYTNFEIVILNDASPYDIKSIVDKFDDVRIRYYENEKNCGAYDLVRNWNKCLNLSEGDYFMCIGDDDYLDVNCLKNYYNTILVYPNVGVIHGQTIVVDEKSKPIKIQEFRPEFESAYSMIYHRIFHGRIQFVGDFLYKTKLLKEVGGFYYIPLAWGTDDITAIIAAKESGIANVSSPCFYYRQNRYTISKSVNPLDKNYAINLEKAWLDNFLSEAENLSTMDAIMVQYTKANIGRYFIKKRVYNLKNYLSPLSFYRLFILIYHAVRRKIRIKEVVMAYIISFK